jgi:CheY-like chemotaxis protein
VEQSEAHQPDLVFVNMTLPLPSDGATVIRELKARQPAVPVVAYASELNGEVGEAIRSVADEGIVPVPAETALAEQFIHRILTTFRLSRRAGME